MDVRWDTMQPSAGKNYGAPESWKAQGNLTNPGLGETMWDVRRHAKGAVRSGIQLPYFLSQETEDVTRLARHTHRLSPGQPPNWRQQCIGFCGNRVLGTPFLFLNPIGLAPPARRQQRRIGVQGGKKGKGDGQGKDQGKDKGKDKSKQSYWQRSP